MVHMVLTENFVDSSAVKWFRRLTCNPGVGGSSPAEDENCKSCVYIYELTDIGQSGVKE